MRVGNRRKCRWRGKGLGRWPICLCLVLQRECLGLDSETSERRSRWLYSVWMKEVTNAQTLNDEKHLRIPVTAGGSTTGTRKKEEKEEKCQTSKKVKTSNSKCFDSRGFNHCIECELDVISANLLLHLSRITKNWLRPLCFHYAQGEEEYWRSLSNSNTPEKLSGRFFKHRGGGG